jgi:hypothetical protein
VYGIEWKALYLVGALTIYQYDLYMATYGKEKILEWKALHCKCSHLYLFDLYMVIMARRRL